ncbi:unnamed protein product [Oikopleura dioica]|uniref:GPALPP motifs-containing protein 1 n=1 Tax=Oikopleura dioica TaxID=34765 RepID=E4YIY9_OIKDI|nr:unnamed protein product [Oikopleura dioica]
MPIGPSLPPHLQKKMQDKESDDDEAGSPENYQIIGPTFPPQLSRNDNSGENIGPTLPPHLQKSSEESGRSRGESIGPAMPPHLQGSTEESNIGPALPPHLKINPDKISENLQNFAKESVSSSRHAFGPAMPPQSSHKAWDSEEEESDFGCPLPPPPVKGAARPPADFVPDEDEDYSVGPAIPAFLLSGSANQEHLEEAEIEARFQKNTEKMKKKILHGDDKKLEREEWMLELPSVRTGNAIVGGTTFRKNAIAANNFGRSEWTKTPGQKGPSKKEQAEEDRKRIQAFAEYEKNQRMAKELEKAKEATKRPNESLFASHQKKLKKKEKEERKKAGNKKERVAFNRETDMQSTILSDAQKKQMMKKTMGLGGRFNAAGGKFL